MSERHSYGCSCGACAGQVYFTQAQLVERAYVESTRAAAIDAENLRTAALEAAQAAAPDEVIRAQRDRLHRALRRLLKAYPRLASEYTTDEQQRAYRVAVCACEECGT